jgi:hypothetical protein
MNYLEIAILNASLGAQPGLSESDYSNTYRTVIMHMRT